MITLRLVLNNNKYDTIESILWEWGRDPTFANSNKVTTIGNNPIHIISDEVPDGVKIYSRASYVDAISGLTEMSSVSVGISKNVDESVLINMSDDSRPPPIITVLDGNNFNPYMPNISLSYDDGPIRPVEVYASIEDKDRKIVHTITTEELYNITFPLTLKQNDLYFISVMVKYANGFISQPAVKDILTVNNELIKFIRSSGKNIAGINGSILTFIVANINIDMEAEVNLGEGWIKSNIINGVGSIDVKNSTNAYIYVRVRDIGSMTWTYNAYCINNKTSEFPYSFPIKIKGTS